MKLRFLLLFIFASIATANAQYINRDGYTIWQGDMSIKKTTRPVSSALLELGKDSTNKGVVLPRVVDTSVITSPVKGMMVYVIPLQQIYFYNGIRWVTWQNNSCPDDLIGSATWSGTGLTYDITVLNYHILCNPYTTAATTVTLPAAHTTLDRKDLIICDIFSQVSVLVGVPGSGIPVPINPFTQKMVAIVDVHAGWLTPYGQSITTIYDENVEWASSSNAIIDFAATTPAPYTGTVSTKVTTPADGTYIQWQRPTGPADISNGQYLKFRIKLSGAPISGRSFLTVTFYNVATQSTNNFIVSNGSYGLDYSSTDWQLIVIPLVSPFYSTTADRVQFVINNASGISFQLDKVYLLEGSNPPPTASGINWLVGGNFLTGIRPKVIGSIDKESFSIITTNVPILTFSENGIEENNTNDVWMLMRRESDGVVFKRKLDSAIGMGCVKVYDSAGLKVIRDTCNGGGGGAAQTFPEVLATGRTFTDKDSVLLGDNSFNFKNGDVKVQERMFIGDTATSSKTFIWYGNSVTIFIPLQKHIHHRFPYIVSKTFNATEDNRGISGTRLVAANGSDSSMENRIYTIGTYNTGDYIFFDYGINDRAAGTDTTTFKTVYLKVIDSCIAKGYPLDHITVLTPTYLAGLDSFRIACITAANLRGVNYVDLYTYMANSGISSDIVLLPDGVHPTVYGHKIYAEAIVQHFPSLPKIGVLDVEGYANITKGLNVDDYVDIHGGLTVEGDSTFDEEKIMLYKKTHASGITKIGFGIHEADTTLRIGSTKGMSFGQWSYGGTFSSKMDIYSNGRVGIGSADLGWTLSVGGNACARFTGIVQVDDRMIIGGSSGATSIASGLNVISGTTSVQGLTVAGDNGVSDSRWKIYKNSNSINSLGVSASGEFLFNAGPNNFVWNYLSTSDGTTLTPLMTLNKTSGNLYLGTTTDVASSILTLAANNKGFLLPRMTSAQRVAISSPANGLLVYDTDSSSLFQYASSTWQNLYNTGGVSSTIPNIDSVLAQAGQFSADRSIDGNGHSFYMEHFSDANFYTDGGLGISASDADGSFSITRNIASANQTTINSSFPGGASDDISLSNGFVDMTVSAGSSLSSIRLESGQILLKPDLGQMKIDSLTNAVSRKALRWNQTTGLVSWADTTALTVSNLGGLGSNVATLLAATPTGTTSLVGSASPTITGTLTASTISLGTTISGAGTWTAGVINTSSNITGNNIVGLGLIRSAAGSTIEHNGRNKFSATSDGFETLTANSGTANTAVLSVGALRTGYVAKTANYTATAFDEVISCSTNAFTVTLPTAVGCAGQKYWITNSTAANNITIATTSSQTFANVTATPTTLTLTGLGSVGVVSDGANWLQLK